MRARHPAAPRRRARAPADVPRRRPGRGAPPPDGGAPPPLRRGRHRDPLHRREPRRDHPPRAGGARGLGAAGAPAGRPGRRPRLRGGGGRGLAGARRRPARAGAAVAPRGRGVPTRRWRRCTGRRCGPGWRRRASRSRRRSTVPPGEASKDFADLASRAGGAAGGGDRPAHRGGRARRRRGGRPRGLRRGGGAARPALRAGADHPARAGGQQRRRQDRREPRASARTWRAPSTSRAIVLADTATLRTLPPRELRAGYAEVAKHGLLAGEAFWGWCESGGGEAAVAGDAAALSHAVLESCRLKAAVVAADEREEAAEGGRALLNLGHTFGHALEAECGYDGTLLHGEGVAVGLGLAAALSARLGHCAQELPGRVMSHLAACGLPARIGDLPRPFSAAALMGRMRRDKKVRDGAAALRAAAGAGRGVHRLRRAGGGGGGRCCGGRVRLAVSGLPIVDPRAGRAGRGGRAAGLHARRRPAGAGGRRRGAGDQLAARPVRGLRRDPGLAPRRATCPSPAATRAPRPSRG